MSAKEILVGVDEFNVVLILPSPVDYKDWLDKADNMIIEFLRLTNIETLFGKLLTLETKKPAGYTNAITIDNVTWYLAIAWHEYFQNMGCLVRFSAEAWANYQKAYEEKFQSSMNISVFLKMIQSDLYLSRLSRIDLTADYKNHGHTLTPNYIYEKLKSSNYIIADCNEKVTNRKISAIESNFGVETFYVGSKKENSKALLRVYDKRKEQIVHSGFRLDEAIQCKDWIRFEASYRGSYAHQITTQIKDEVSNDIELSQLIASKITDKFRFLDNRIDDYTDFTNDLLDIANSATYSALRSENPKNNDLRQSISYLINGSGLFPIIYKVGQIWGEEAEVELWELLYDVYKNTYKKEAHKDAKLRSWLKHNYQSLSRKRQAHWT